MNKFEKRFAATESHIEVTRASYPAFPRESAIVIRLIKHIYRVVQDQTNVTLRPWEVNHAEFNLMMMLYGTKGHSMSPSELGEAAGEKLANITRLINRLTEKGLIQRATNDEDRRRAVVSLTEDGLACVEEFLPPISQLLEQEMCALTRLEQHMLELLLKKMLTGLEMGDQQDPEDVQHF